MKFYNLRGQPEQVLLGQHGVEVVGLTDEIAVRAFGKPYFLPGSPIAKYLSSLLETIQQDAKPEYALLVATMLGLVTHYLGRNEQLSLTRENLRRHLEFHGSSQIAEDIVDLDELCDLLNATTWKIFDPAFWVRKNQSS